jgi:hypothetical protein
VSPGGPQVRQPRQLDAVTLTGIREGIEGAISAKKGNATSVVEPISAEGIGKLPRGALRGLAAGTARAPRGSSVARRCRA